VPADSVAAVATDAVKEGSAVIGAGAATGLDASGGGAPAAPVPAKGKKRRGLTLVAHSGPRSCAGRRYGGWYGRRREEGCRRAAGPCG